MAKQRPDLSGERARSAGVDSQIGWAFIGLREMLLHGELGCGERISELPLVARLGTSRTPISLALERLAHIGLLDVLPAGGFTVRGFTLAEALDAIELRGVLEGREEALENGSTQRSFAFPGQVALRRSREETDHPVTSFQAIFGSGQPAIPLH
jgi:DNA-binding GntR family transcriptional regulator